jgi:hypothetical protein
VHVHRASLAVASQNFFSTLYARISVRSSSEITTKCQPEEMGSSPKANRGQRNLQIKMAKTPLFFAWLANVVTSVSIIFCNKQLMGERLSSLALPGLYRQFHFSNFLTATPRRTIWISLRDNVDCFAFFFHMGHDGPAGSQEALPRLHPKDR